MIKIAGCRIAGLLQRRLATLGHSNVLITRKEALSLQAYCTDYF